MQRNSDGLHFEQFIGLLCDYFQGKGGDAPTKTDLQEAGNILASYNDWRGRQAAGKAIKKNSILVAMRGVYAKAREIESHR